MISENNKIKYAFLLDGWSFEHGDKQELSTNARKIIPSEYMPIMKGSIFCPACFTNLSRSPKDKQLFSNGRKACFVHLPTYSNVDCDLRTPKPEGMLYPTEELAKQAIADEQLAIISSFRTEAPLGNAGPAGPYNQSAVEDIAGPLSHVPISRHKGESFKLPSKITTVAGICRKFDENFYKYYVFPGKTFATRLVNSLINIADVEETDDVPKLYFGEILSSFNAGNTPKPTNLRMTELRCHKNIKDFYLKAIDSEQTEKGIGDQSKERIVLFWGKITWSGIGLCIERPKWGEYVLVRV
jgi:hypothetical protein